jgi:hypothetical protein
MDLSYGELYSYLNHSEKDEFKDMEKKSLSSKRGVVDANMNTDKKHLEYVNLCIKPFEVGGRAYKETGYYFVCVDPLYNVGVKNFDLMLYCEETKVAILIECKSGIANLGKELNELTEKMGAAQENKRTLEGIIGGLEIKDIEYVLCIPAVYESGVFTAMAALKTKPPIIIWTVDMFGGVIKVDGRFKKHSHDELNKIIQSEAWDGPQIITLMPSTHMGIALTEVVVLLLRKFKGRNELNISDLCEMLKTEIRNYPNDWIQDFATKILESGKECNIFEVNGSKFKFTMSTNVYAVKTATERYISYHSNKLMKAELEPILYERVKNRIKVKTEPLGEQKVLFDSKDNEINAEKR